MDVVERIIAGHRLVDEKKDILKKLVKMLDNDAFFWDNAVKIEYFFKIEVREHFVMEEKVLFPVMKKVLKAQEREVLKEIELEHGPIILKLTEFQAISGSHLRYASKATREPMVKAACELIEMIMAHAKKEDKHLFPLIRERFDPENYTQLEDLYFKFLKV